MTKIKLVAAVGILQQGERLLAIQRAATVRAPNKWCFPGGGVENSESIEQALVRELKEELNLVVVPKKKTWQSVTPWQTELHWWTVTCDSLRDLNANTNEVADLAWLTARELRTHPDLLESNHQFLDLLLSGEINLDGT